MSNDSYTRSEVLAAGGELPERGPLCHECDVRIPQFAELGEAAERRIRRLIREQRPVMAISELRSATGCSISWAKLWVQHEGRAKPHREPAPCPYCGEPLRTPLASQCRFCLRDWHDSEIALAPDDD